MRLLLGAFLLTLLIGVVAAQQSGSALDMQKPFPGKFVDVTSALGVHFNYLSSHSPKHYLLETMGGGVALFDYDNDGPAHILHNETPTQNHWLTLKLVGHKSNRDAIGAEVKIVSAKGQQFGTVSTAGSYLSSSDKRVHFGLGSESTAQSVEIRWPSGIQRTLKNVRTDQILTVDEPTTPSTQK